MPRHLIFTSLIWLLVSALPLRAGGVSSPYGLLRPTVVPHPSTVPTGRPSLAALADGPAVPARVMAKLRYRLIARAEAEKSGVPYDLVDAVMDIESAYDPTRRGDVGEIGLMQVRPATAAMLGFKGDANALADPAVNIHFGSTYLGRAWQLAGGNVCRALMKYRAGHGEDGMSERSVAYCRRAHAHLKAANSPLADTIAVADFVPDRIVSAPARRPPITVAAYHPDAAVARPSRELRSSARFWARHEARIRKINARIEARWRRMAAR